MDVIFPENLQTTSGLSILLLALFHSQTQHHMIKYTKELHLYCIVLRRYNSQWIVPVNAFCIQYDDQGHCPSSQTVKMQLSTATVHATTETVPTIIQIQLRQPLCTEFSEYSTSIVCLDIFNSLCAG